MLAVSEPFRRSALKPLPQGRRRLQAEARDELVVESDLEGGRRLPLVLSPAREAISLQDWATVHRELIESHLTARGAILFRNFGIRTAGDFEAFVRACGGELLHYTERTSPRKAVSGRIYTSTEHPADQRIFLHNELSYARTFPLKLFFFCLEPALVGGETPIADTRAILTRIEPSIRGRLIERKYQYVRNFGSEFGLTWQEAFQTTDRREVDAYCRRADISCEWIGETRLRTRQIRSVVARHPKSKELVWFNHAAFFHPTTLESAVHEALVDAFGEDQLPNNTFYGDGSRLEPETVDALRRAYEAQMTTFAWQQGDILLLDNMLVAHGRMPYQGNRRVLVAMTEPVSRESVDV